MALVLYMSCLAKMENVVMVMDCVVAGCMDYMDGMLVEKSAEAQPMQGHVLAAANRRIFGCNNDPGILPRSKNEQLQFRCRSASGGDMKWDSPERVIVAPRLPPQMRHNEQCRLPLRLYKPCRWVLVWICADLIHLNS